MTAVPPGTPDRVLVVDAANVIGSRPDGWWRDRAGAAARLVARLDITGLGFDHAVIVLEGAARQGAPAGESPLMRIVHAAGSGDDELVHQVRLLTAQGVRVTLATADRGLLARVAHLGVRTLGPGTVRAAAN